MPDGIPGIDKVKNDAGRHKDNGDDKADKANTGIVFTQKKSRNRSIGYQKQLENEQRCRKFILHFSDSFRNLRSP